MNYEESMRYGATQYADVLTLLQRAGYKASFTQTGGMCAAIEIVLDGGATILITDAEDTLSWERCNHHGWAVGLYPPDNEYDTESLAYRETEDGGIASLLPLVESLLCSR